MTATTKDKLTKYTILYFYEAPQNSRPGAFVQKTLLIFSLSWSRDTPSYGDWEDPLCEVRAAARLVCETGGKPTRPPPVCSQRHSKLVFYKWQA